MTDIIERFVRRLKRIGIDVQLSANAPWVYLDSVNGMKVVERFHSEHGFTAFWLPVREGLDIVFTDRRKVFAKVREYAKSKKALQDMTTWQEENGLYEDEEHMTYEQALQIAMEELYDAVIDLRYNNKGYHAHIESQCNRLLTARNALCKALEEMQEKREWVYLTLEEMLDIVDTYGMQLADSIEAKVKEKNT